MPRIHLPLLPIPVLAVTFAVVSCSRPRSNEPVAHVIPPASTYYAARSAPASSHLRSKALTPPATVEDETPSAGEVEAFERAVPK